MEKQFPPITPGFEHIRRFWDKGFDKSNAKILPGELYVTAQDELVSTVLGSCVSACIRDRVFGIGGMNHFMLPLSHNAREQDVISAATRYGNFAMEHLINEIISRGGLKKNLEVKVFGGAKVIPTMGDVGARNIEFVVEYLANEGLRIEGKDLGGDYPRKLIYHPLSGKVKMKRLESIQTQQVLRQEEEYMHQIEEKPVAGEIELF